MSPTLHHNGRSVLIAQVMGFIGGGAITVAFAQPARGGTAEGFASAVISYEPGAAPAGGFTDPLASLGEPTRLTGAPFVPGAVTPFNPAWMPADVVSIGAGGSLTLALDAPATDHTSHLYGVDLILFGNSFFSDAAPPSGVAATLIADGGVVEVSADGVSWFIVSGAAADGLWPTLGFLDVGPYSVAAGVELTDFRTPIDPALAASDAIGLAWDELVALYGGSAGGIGIDLAAVGLEEANFIRIRNPAGSLAHVEVDGVARTRELGGSGPDLDSDGTVSGADLAILVGAFGDASTDGDVDGDGDTDGADLAQLLGAWS